MRAGSSTGEIATTPRTLPAAPARRRRAAGNCRPSEKPARYSGCAPQRAAIARSAPVTSLEPAGMKQPLIERLRAAVIAQVEPHDGVALRDTAAPPAIARSRTRRCLPSRAAARRCAPCGARRAVPGLQPHAALRNRAPRAAPLHDARARASASTVGAAAGSAISIVDALRATSAAAGSAGPVPARWQRPARASRQRMRARTSTRLFAAAARFHSPAVNIAEATG